MSVVIAGGGTGGHIFPALAVGQELVSRNVGIMFVGTRKGLESDLVPKRGWKIEYLSSPRWKGESGLGRVKAMIQMPLAIARAWKMLSVASPDVVIGVGGYASAPVVMAAALKRIPSLVMEQNSIPGLTNRILGHFVKRVCLTFPASSKYFSSKKVSLTGNPVREEIKKVSRDLPSFNEKFVVMCFGGSQGAKSINEAMFASLRFLRDKKEHIKIIHQIGSSVDIDIAKDLYAREGFTVEVYRFIDDIASCYARSHLVLCRAGATSIAELTVVGRPAILVPYPSAADDHQTKNAEYVADNGGALLVKNSDLTGEKVAELISGFMSDTAKLKDMSEAMKRLSMLDAAEKIGEECFRLCTQSTGTFTL